MLLHAQAAEIPGSVLSAEILAGGRSPRIFRIRVFIAYFDETLLVSEVGAGPNCPRYGRFDTNKSLKIGA